MNHSFLVSFITKSRPILSNLTVNNKILNTKQFSTLITTATTTKVKSYGALVEPTVSSLIRYYGNDLQSSTIINRFPSTKHRFISTDALTNRNSNDGEEKEHSKYHWIDTEAHGLIQKAYTRHKALADKSQSFPPSLSVNDLEKIGIPYHYEPKDFVDRLALNLMKGLRIFVHAFFREKYDHHAVCLETVAAIPGAVASIHRHLRSLRRMKRDHGWVSVLQEEAENERMHLLIVMKVCEPTTLERGLVLLAQGIYFSFYSTLYLLHPRAAHRLTGYLEEEAHRAYTDYIRCLDEGAIPNKPAPNIAKRYYHLADDARMRDVILHIRADEAMHRDVNHQFGVMYEQGKTDTPLHKQ